jgi:hypothetical protein
MAMKLKIEFKPDSKRPYQIKPDGTILYHWRDWDSAKVWNWCAENFGHRNKGYDNPRWYGDPNHWHGDFQFRNKKDAAWFMLRWT